MYKNFLPQWECLSQGSSFIGAEIMFIHQVLAQEIAADDEYRDLTKKAGRISRSLKYTLGKGEWQVVLIKGNHAKKFFCSRQFHCTFRKKDGLLAYIWVTRFKDEQETEFSL